MINKKVAVVVPLSSSGIIGGAERFYNGLLKGLNSTGVNAEMVEMVVDECSFDNIKKAYLEFYDKDLSKYDGVISTKAPTYAVKHHNHICYLVHTIRVFYDMFEKEYKNPDPYLFKVRDYIQNLDTLALGGDRVKKIFSIGHEVSNRLLKYNGIKSEVLHPPLLDKKFKTGTFDNYIFIPGRLHRWKRLDLIIESMKYVKNDIKLYIAGCGEDEEKLKDMAKDAKNIKFLGRISDKELVDFYSNALAVPFVPVNEDYGYITIEAFQSGKPVITCSDSGEPSWFVKNANGGFVVEPQPESIAEKIDFLADNVNDAKKLGNNGFNYIEGLSWDRVAEKLLKELFPNE